MELTSRSQQLLSKLLEHKLLLIGPIVLGFVLSIVYVLFLKSESWTTRQRLMVRDDLLGQSFKPGQFSSLDSMKSRQETILEIARNPEVIRETLRQLGPARKSWFSSSENYPDNQTIEDVQGNINLNAPNGAEFGKTEVVLLSVKASGTERSLNFIKLLIDQIEQKIALVRNSQLKSMVSEIQQARDGAKKSLQESIDQLRAMEKELGADSITMASLTSTTSGDSALKMETVQIQSEKRAVESQLESLLTSQQTLLESKDDPMLIVSSSSSFLKDQSKLGQIAKSLVDAQKQYADAIGRYQEIHPAVQTALGQLNAMKEQVSVEVAALNSAVASQISELEARMARLDSLIESNNQRLIRLNERRGDHLAINSEIIKRMEVLNQHEATLKSIQGLSEASGGAVWFTRIGDPQPSSSPDGLGKKATVLIGGMLGFLLGLGVLILVAFPIDFGSLAQETKQETQASIPHLGAAKSKTQADMRRVNQNFGDGSQSVPGSAKTETAAGAVDSRVAIDDSVSIPNVAAPRELNQLDKFVSSVKAKTNSSTQKSARNVDAIAMQMEIVADKKKSELARAKAEPKTTPARTQTGEPVDLLTELRNNWAAQTDPLSNINAKNSPVDLKIGVDDEAMVSTLPPSQPVFDVNKIHSKISGMQRSNSKSEDIERIKQSFEATPGNPFIRNSAKASTKQPIKGNLAEQIKAIGGTVIGLVDSKSK